MKKIVLLLSFAILCGCATFSKLTMPSQTIDNPKCNENQRIQIFQALDHGALAWECEYASYTDCKPGLVVYVPAQKGEEFYDDMMINVPEDKCISFKGTYKYTTKDRDKTVPKVVFIDSQIPNPEYIEWKKQHQDK